jgi:hypothetical protein
VTELIRGYSLTPSWDNEPFEQLILESVRLEFGVEDHEIEGVYVGDWVLIGDGVAWAVYYKGTAVEGSDWIMPGDGGLQEAFRHLAKAIAKGPPT